MTEEMPVEIESEDVKVVPPEITITLRRSHLFTILMPLTFILGLGLGYLVWGRAPVAVASEISGDQSAADPTPQQVVRYDVSTDDDPSIGPADAAITIVEFSDYECPYCRRWHTEVFTRLLDAYPDQVRLVYRDFPLTSIHPNAFPAAEAANCANDQGGFWEFSAMLYSMELGLGQESYLQYASRLGFDEASFSECLDSRRFQQEVQADFDFAADLGVSSTPTFFINGIAVVGAQPYEVFQNVIDKELAGEIP